MESELSDEIYERMFRAALLIRMVEKRIVDIYPTDKIQSPVHLSIGQEAVAVGVCEALRLDDLVYATYRSHGFYIAKGGSLRAMFAELYGRVGGVSKGKAGSMHLCAPEVGLMGSSAVVASSIPHAVGSAMSFKRRGIDRVAVAVFGDGATEEGVYHESLNLASLMRLPVLFVCENNGLAVHSRRGARQSYDGARHSRSYGLDYSAIADGWNMRRIRETALDIVEQVRRGEPHVLEIKTARYREHVGIEEDFHRGYRALSDLEQFISMDPLLVDAVLAERLRPELEAEIEDAVRFAENSPPPGLSHLLEDVI